MGSSFSKILAVDDETSIATWHFIFERPSRAMTKGVIATQKNDALLV